MSGHERKKPHPGAVPGMAMEPNMRSRLLSSSDSVPDSSCTPTADRAARPSAPGDESETVTSLSLPPPPPPEGRGQRLMSGGWRDGTTAGLVE
jgi:hypothetical protein